MTASILENLNDIFQNYFDDEDIQLNSTTTAADIDDWDSLAQVGLVISIEKKFGLKFTSAEIEQLSNIGEMVDLINEKS
ncbi:MAG: acyl carrier protein [Alphaproteobacteria bacterium]|nr:acyl carrier protein [Alphaproteobacteria bacterium]